MSLEVNVTKRFDGFTLHAAFTAGDTATAILGASGCGKSMTLRCIAGIVRPDEGRIVLDGRVLFDSAQGIDLPPQQRNVGLLFQTALVAVRMSMFVLVLVVVSATACVAVCVSVFVLMFITTAAIIAMLMRMLFMFMVMIVSVTACIAMSMLRHMSHSFVIMVLAAVTAGAAFRMLAVILYTIDMAVDVTKSSYIAGTVTDIF